VGTGDGRFVLALARARPDTLVIGLDAVAAGMAEASRRAARRGGALPRGGSAAGPERHPPRGSLKNALFAVAAAEHPP
jgi:16S rRNA (adenine(1408)-N(1))-methyltransferase